MSVSRRKRINYGMSDPTLFMALSPVSASVFAAILAGKATGHPAAAIGKLLQHGLIVPRSVGGYRVQKEVRAAWEAWKHGG